MALKEGRCPNCGSLLQLETKYNQGHCLFCDAVFDADVAYAIIANPEDVTFPNLPQPRYEGPNLNPQLNPVQAQFRTVVTDGKSKKKHPPAEVAPSQPAYVPRTDIKAPELKLTIKARLILIGIALAAIALVVGLSTPAILRRDAVRSQLYAQMPDLLPTVVDADKAVVIHGAGNQRLQVILPEAISEAEALTLFKDYATTRANLAAIDPADFKKTYGSLTVSVAFPTGGFEIEKPATEADLDSGAALKKLS
jgi:hypothetical protein